MALTFPREAARELEKRIQGSVVAPGDPQYDGARRVFVNTYEAFPQIIVYCGVFRDVCFCLDFARRFGLTVTCRSGGHSTAGFSVNSGMVLDVSRINHVVVDAARRVAIVGAGASFARVNASLDTYRLHVPGGGCSDVGVGGFMLGGGYGLTSLLYGMNCDNAVEAVVALADGNLVTASERENADLFWALRGGGGNNLGVLLQVTYALHDLWRVSAFGISWDLDDAAEPLAALQQAFTGLAVPADLAWQGMIASVEGRPRLLIRGLHQGTRTAAKGLLAPLLRTRGAVLDIDTLGTYHELNNALLEIPGFPSRDPEDRTMTDSRYLARRLSAADWRDVIARIRRVPDHRTMIGFEPYGGRIAAVPASATAFVHRSVSLNMFAWVVWSNDAGQATCRSYLDEFAEVLAQYGNGQANQNYPRRDNRHYQQMYWGDNLHTLCMVKRKYDPDNLFRFGQTVTGLPDEDVVAGASQRPTLLIDIPEAIERSSVLWRPSPWTAWRVAPSEAE